MNLKNKKGSIIFSLLVTTGVMVASISYYFTQMSLSQKMNNNRLMISTGLKAHVVSLQSILRSQGSLIKTLKSNSNGDLWSCINNAEFFCSQLTPAPLNVFTEMGNGLVPFVDSSANKGLTESLEVCSSFPSLACPFRYELTWYAECPALTASCRSPDIFIEGGLKIAGNIVGVINLNPANYALLMRIK